MMFIVNVEDHLLITVVELADLPNFQASLDRSQIGCYVSHNNRLIDVMVLSDQDYNIKVPISYRNTDDDRIQVMFKKLAGGDDEDPIGIHSNPADHPFRQV
jgi:hypothetical protein